MKDYEIKKGVVLSKNMNMKKRLEDHELSFVLAVAFADRLIKAGAGEAG